MRMILSVSEAMVYGKILKAGDEFECPEKEARLWAALARAKSSDGSLEVGQRKRRGRPPNSYNRRDMRAED